MTKSVEFHDGARRDFDESFNWYAERSRGAALGFVLEFDASLERITVNPQRFPRTSARCQYTALHRYPYRVVFREEAVRIVIVAVAHAKRRPHYWRDRK